MNVLPALALALALQQAPANDVATAFQQAEALDQFAALKFSDKQIPAVFQASQTVQEALREHAQKTDELEASETHLPPIVQAMAAGQTLTAEQRAHLEAAERKRTQLDEQLRSKIDAAVKQVQATMTTAQQWELVPDRHKQRANEALTQIRNASAADWPRVRERIADVIIRNEERKLRASFDSRETGLTREQRRNERRQQEQALEQWGEQYVDRIRNGGTTLHNEFIRTYAANSLDQGDFEEDQQRAIEELLRNPGTVPALTKRWEKLQGGG